MKNKYQYAGDRSWPDTKSGTSYKRRARLRRRISWGSVVAGALIALLSMMILNLLGISFGLGTINPAEGTPAFSALSTEAIGWWVVSNLMAIFTGSYFASRLAATPFAFTSTLHGILTWCLYTLAFFYLLSTSLGNLMSGAGNVVTGTLSGIDPKAEMLQENVFPQSNTISMHEVKREVKQILRDTESPAAAANTSTTLREPENDNLQPDHQNLSNRDYLPEEEIEEIAREVLYNGEGFADQVDRQNLANIIQDQTYLSTSEARDVADIMIRQYRKAKRAASQQEQYARRQAEENGQQVKEAASAAAIWIFASLILGAVVAGVGGRTGKSYTLQENTSEESKR